MLFLDDFLEMLEELPHELRERCADIRNLDMEVTTATESTRRSIREFFQAAEGMTPEQREARMAQFREVFAKLRKCSEDKIAIAERMQELLEKYTQHLDKEKTHFKYELEADNPGVTEMIEKRFSDVVEQMVAMRKSSKKRAFTSNGTANGGGAGGQHDDASSSSSSSSSQVNGHASTPRPPPVKLPRMRGDSVASEMSEHSPAPSTMRGRKASQMVEEGTLKDRRDSMRAHLHATLSTKISMSASPSALSPLPMDSGRSGRGTPTSSAAATPPTRSPSASHHGSFSFPTSSSPAAAAGSSSSAVAAVSSLAASSSSATTPTTPFIASSAMPNFTGLESRHGRARKLTTRVQEMFNSQSSLVSQRERHARAAVAIAERAEREKRQQPPTYHHSSSSEHHEEEEDPSDDRPWCYCGEKSYGGMVACDNKQCVYEWFHLPCIGLEDPPKGKWFCPDCAKKKKRQRSASEDDDSSD